MIKRFHFYAMFMVLFSAHSMVSLPINLDTTKKTLAKYITPFTVAWTLGTGAVAASGRVLYIKMATSQPCNFKIMQSDRSIKHFFTMGLISGAAGAWIGTYFGPNTLH